MIDRKSLAIHFIGKDRLPILRQFQTNRAVEVSRSSGVRLGCGFVVERVKDDLPDPRKWPAESDDMTQGDAAPLRNARPALDAAVIGDLGLFRHRAEIGQRKRQRFFD